MSSDVMLVEEHFARFRQCCPNPFQESEKEGRSPRNWFKLTDVEGSGVPVGELPTKVNRQELLNLARKPEFGTLELCICIFAWGGMHGANRKRLFAQPVTPWVALADQIRGGRLTRAEGYAAFTKLRSGTTSEIAGLGPAFFTKLLYFLPPGPPVAAKGYIMDQWLGCAINLLAGQQLVKLDHHLVWEMKSGKPVVDVNSVVSGVNSSEDYERFCLAIEAVSRELGPAWTPDKVERALIADGGANPHPWREYVVAQRRSFVVNGRF